jgi:malate synthase
VRSSKRTRLRVPGVVINALAAPRQDEILTPQAVAFLAGLHRAFDVRRRALLQARTDGVAPRDADGANSPGGGEWAVAPLAPDPVGRVVETADAADRQMMLKALHSGATDCLADLADADARGWPEVIAGQANLRDVCNGNADLAGATPALLVVRPRPWHVPEAHVLVDASPISAGLFDFGLYVFHNARTQIAKGAKPHFQLSHLASQAEARLWNDVLIFARDKLDIPSGAIKATVLIDGLTAFEATC